MNKIIAYLKWVLRGWSFEQWLWVLGGGFAGGGMADFIRTGEPGLSMHIAAGLWLTILLKWLVWDTFKASWRRFEEERAKLFETIDKGKYD